MTIHTNILTLNDLITPNKSFTRGGHKGQLTLPPAFLRKSASRKMMRAWGIIS